MGVGGWVHVSLEMCVCFENRQKNSPKPVHCTDILVVSCVFCLHNIDRLRLHVNVDRSSCDVDRSRMSTHLFRCVYM